jgi:hypothetical protein
VVLLLDGADTLLVSEGGFVVFLAWWLSERVVELMPNLRVVDRKTLLALSGIDWYVFAGDSDYFAGGLF